MKPSEVPDLDTQGTPAPSTLILPNTSVEEAPAAAAKTPAPLKLDEASAQAPAEKEASTPSSELAPAVPSPIDGFSWQASEYIHHVKSAGWYLGLAAVTALLIVIAILAKQWFGIIVFVAMFATVVVYARKAPRTLNYTIDTHGITFEDKLRPFNQFRSFSVSRDVAWHAIDLEPTQRLAPRQTILFDEKDLDQIVSRLGAELPRDDHQPDAAERMARYLRF